MIDRPLTTDAPQVFIDCMACFNEHGVGHAPRSGWVDAVDAERLAEEVCPHPLHEETWCYDHQGFDGMLHGECSPSEATRIAEWILEVENEADLGVPLPVILNYLTGLDSPSSLLKQNAWELAQQAADRYCGVFDSWTDRACEFIESLGTHIIIGTPADLKYNILQKPIEIGAWPLLIDWDAIGRDLTYYESAVEYEGSLYIFRNE